MAGAARRNSASPPPWARRPTSLFCLYLVLLPLLWLLWPAPLHCEWSFSTSSTTHQILIFTGPPVVTLPLFAYSLAVLVQTLVSVFTHGLFKSLLALPLVVLTHIFYGVGFWRGLFTTLRQAGAGPRTEVVLDRFTM